MLLPNSLSSTKKLFQRTIQSVKSLFCGGTYQRLPKTPPSKPFPCIENYFSQSCNRDQSDIFVKIGDKPAAVKKRSKNKILTSSTPQLEKRDDLKKKKRIAYQGITREEEISKTCKGDIIIREERRCLVAKKLKELENMDLMMTNIVENVLDIEEVLHFYSSLTCPVYIDIFDKFFMGVYSDLFNLKAAEAHGRPRLVSHN